jgi:hypothetical protein
VPTFPAETVTAVLNHMNQDHLDDCVLIARAFGDPAASAAEMTCLDHAGGTWVYTVDGATRELVVPWSTEISERAEIRREIVVLHDRACEKLGIEPTPH